MSANAASSVIPTCNPIAEVPQAAIHRNVDLFGIPIFNPCVEQKRVTDNPSAGSLKTRTNGRCAWRKPSRKTDGQLNDILIGYASAVDHLRATDFTIRFLVSVGRATVRYG